MTTALVSTCGVCSEVVTSFDHADYTEAWVHKDTQEQRCYPDEDVADDPTHGGVATPILIEVVEPDPYEGREYEHWMER